MNLKFETPGKLFVQLIVIALFVNFAVDVADAQNLDFFFSDRSLNDGAINQNLQISAEEGSMISLYIYYTTNGLNNSELDTGGFLDLFFPSSATGGRFVDGETFDFDIFETSPLQDSGVDRWNVLGGGGLAGPPVSVDDDFIELAAFTVIGGTGIVEANNGQADFIDMGYDQFADAFLFGRVDLEVIGNTGETFAVAMVPGPGGLVNGQSSVDPSFGLAFIQISNTLLGDINGDGQVDLLDVGPFVDLLTAGDFLAEADINGDGDVDLLDVGPFVELLSGG